MNIIQIVKGHVYHALNINEPLRQYREDNGCKKCFYGHKDGHYNGQCNRIKGGCGCLTGPASRVPNYLCPHGVWAEDWFKPEVLEAINKEKGFTV